MTTPDTPNSAISASDKHTPPELRREVLRGWLGTHAAEALFGSVDEKLLDVLEDKFKWLSLAGGELLCCQGDPADSMYLVVSGRLRFTFSQPDGSRRVAGEIGPGETVGEFALITDEPRSASVITVRASNVLCLTRPAFEDLTASYPQLMRNITRIIIQRTLRTMQDSVKNQPARTQYSTLHNLMLMPARPRLDLRPFAEQLKQALERAIPHARGQVRILCAADLENALGPGSTQAAKSGLHDSLVVDWLNEQEARNTFLLYLAEDDWTAWTQRCLSQSDRVLVVAAPGGDPQPRGLERRVAVSAATPVCDLALWHADTATEHPEPLPYKSGVLHRTPPSNTLPWLESRPWLHAHYHVRDGDPAHFDRLARTLTGRAIGLVLSGGGARGFAHLGVFRALEELNIPVDYIGGASFGALVGLPLAYGMTWQQIMEVSQEFTNPKALFDTTLPLVALYESKKLTRFIQKAFAGIQLEDCWTPFFATTVNLTQARVEVVRRGPAWLTIRKSVSVPAVFVPVPDHGDLYVDGGLMNNLPVDVMLELSGSQRVIGVLVTSLAPEVGGGSVAALTGAGESGVMERRQDFDLSQALRSIEETATVAPLIGDVDSEPGGFFSTTNPWCSGWRALWNRINPLSAQQRSAQQSIPNLGNLIAESMVAAAYLHTRNISQQADLLLHPLASNVGILEFHRYAEVAQFGYEQTVEALREWRARQEDL